MDSALEEEEPHEEAHRQVEGERADSHPLRRPDRRQQQQRPSEEAEGDFVGVEDRDDRDRSDVIDDCECEQEELSANRHPAPEKGDHAHREGDVGCHGDSPPVEGPGGVSGDHDIESRGQQHPPERRHDG